MIRCELSILRRTFCTLSRSQYELKLKIYKNLELIRLRTFIKTVNIKDSQFAIVFSFFMIIVIGEKREW